MTNTIHRLKEHAAAAKRLAQAIARAHDLAEDDQAVLDTVEGETDILLAIKRAVIEAQQLKSLAESLAERISKLQERKARFAEAHDHIRATVADVMMDTGYRSALRFDEFTLSARTTAPGIEIIPEDLPDEYKKDKVTRVPDRDHIAAAIDQGADVPGVRKTNGKPSLTVRT